MSDYQRAVGQLMRARRKELGVTLAYVARALDYTPTCIGGWERGVRTMRVEDLADVARVYGVATRELLPADPEGYWWTW